MALIGKTPRQIPRASMDFWVRLAIEDVYLNGAIRGGVGSKARTHTHPSCREAKMFHATHRFLFPKVFAFTLVLLATTLFSVALVDAQVTGEPTECWSNCHAEATDYYNNSSAPTKVKQYVASQLMNDCLEDNLC